MLNAKNSFCYCVKYGNFSLFISRHNAVMDKIQNGLQPLCRLLLFLSNLHNM